MNKQNNGLRIAMWSGPRNISTAMMRSFENRSDCYVCDEPLYAHYLVETGLDHPGRAETIAGHHNSWQDAVSWLTGPIPEGKAVWYQKHMAHHLLPSIDRSWLDGMFNCFLIRDPGEMLPSLIKFIPQPRVIDTGLPQQVELFEKVVSDTGETPPVIDGKDVLENPARVLEKLCQAIGIGFQPTMLKWPTGTRKTDGAWAPYWYERVVQTSEFAPYQPKLDPLPAELDDVLHECQSLYSQLYQYRIV